MKEELPIAVEEPDTEKANQLALSGEYCQPRFSEKKDAWTLNKERLYAYMGGWRMIMRLNAIEITEANDVRLSFDKIVPESELDFWKEKINENVDTKEFPK